jgi:acyl-CoA reductase-like NAD-dependent aldehyde dehydrogenase
MTTTLLTAAPFADAVRACRHSQEDWGRTRVRQRLQAVRAFRHLLARECLALCDAVAQDLGKPAEETLAGEVLPLAAACRFLEQAAPRVLRARNVPSAYRPLWLFGQTDRVYRRPRGVVGIIGTWNYPVFLNGVQITQALTAGNGVLWKPSELGASSARVLFDMLRRAGFPENLMQLLPPTREAGQELADAAIDHIVFTGSSATGRRLAEALGRRLVSSTLELSGCDAMLVLDDADVQLAARAAWFGATANCGQTCIAARRAFVHQSVYSRFIEALRPLATGAAPLRLALEAQARQAERLVHTALSEGASLLDPSTAEGNGAAEAVRPVILVDARPDMAVCQEASFAPLLAVIPFERIENALEMNERCAYGLGASVFTGNRERGVHLAEKLKAGMVAVNDVIVPTAHPATPFGGWGESGWGVTQGADGLREMTVPQVVSVRSGKLRPHYDSACGKPPLPAEGFRGLLEWSHGGTWGERWGGLRRLLRTIWRGAN